MLGRYLLPGALLCALACADDVPSDDAHAPTGSMQPAPTLGASSTALDAGAGGEDAGAQRTDAGAVHHAGAHVDAEGPPEPRDAGAEDARLDAGDAASGGGASSARADAGAPCNALRPNMFSVSLSASSDPMPERQRGGMIYDGTYRLDEAVVYDPDPQRAQGVPEMRVETLKIQGEVWQHVAYWNSQPTTHFTHRSSLRENSFSLGLTCGSEADARVFGGLPNLASGSYTALPQMLTLEVRGDGEAGHIYVLKYLRIE